MDKLQNMLPEKAHIINVVVLFVEHVGKADQDDFHKGDEQVEDEPEVYHLDVGGPRQRIRDADEECGEHEERCHIHGHIGLKVAGLLGKEKGYMFL